MTIAAAIIYFVNPFDLIPDFILGFGYIDDAAIFGYVLRSFKGDIDNFRNWERGRGSGGPVV